LICRTCSVSLRLYSGHEFCSTIFKVRRNMRTVSGAILGASRTLWDSLVYYEHLIEGFRVCTGRRMLLEWSDEEGWSGWGTWLALRKRKLAQNFSLETRSLREHLSQRMGETMSLKLACQTKSFLLCKS
jgi:hypothetical protein